MTLRYLTAGESHGPALVGILEGLPAGVPVDRAGIARQLERRRLGHGRSPRMSFESDRFEILGGVRHGATIGSPVALVIHNAEWSKWTEVMGVDPPGDPEALELAGDPRTVDGHTGRQPFEDADERRPVGLAGR
ncbi:MAG TPA: chorismate synthase, partial [Egibacteraceae bacterium]|nr:chorismate synthase [Egibacteraceae bacterium]